MREIEKPFLVVDHRIKPISEVDSETLQARIQKSYDRLRELGSEQLELNKIINGCSEELVKRGLSKNVK